MMPGAASGVSQSGTSGPSSFTRSDQGDRLFVRWVTTKTDHVGFRDRGLAQDVGHEVVGEIQSLLRVPVPAGKSVKRVAQAVLFQLARDAEIDILRKFLQREAMDGALGAKSLAVQLVFPKAGRQVPVRGAIPGDFRTHG